jgi:hypothetical protein
MFWGDPLSGTLMFNDDKTPKMDATTGKQALDFSVGVLIPKNPGEQSWAQTAWGKRIYELGIKFWGNLIQRDDFAWKVRDGDSTKLNKMNKRPCDDPNQRGHWVVTAGTRIPPDLCGPQGQPTPEWKAPGVFYPGCWVQVYIGSIKSNESQRTPGVYLNLKVVSFQGPGPKIEGAGVDTAALGFGSQALPAAAVAYQQQGGMVAAQHTQAPLPGMTAAPVPAPMATGLPQLPGMGAPAPLAVAPNPQFAPLPGTVAAPAVVATGLPQLPGMPPPLPSAVVAPPVRVLVGTATAGGHPIEAFRAQGWTDDALVTAGYFVWSN